METQGGDAAANRLEIAMWVKDNRLDLLNVFIVSLQDIASKQSEIPSLFEAEIRPFNPASSIAWVMRRKGPILFSMAMAQEIFPLSTRWMGKRAWSLPTSAK